MQIGLRLTNYLRVRLTERSKWRQVLEYETLHHSNSLNNSGNASGFSHDDLEYLRIVASSSDKLEVPLRLALFISPLFLLIPKSLHKLKRRVDFFEVIEVRLVLRSLI
jgi:hypothetical protein